MSKKKNHNIVIAYNIKDLRKSKGWTQYELADELYKYGYEITRDSIAQFETGRRNIPVHLLIKLRQVFGLESYDRFFLNENNDLI